MIWTHTVFGSLCEVKSNQISRFEPSHLWYKMVNDYYLYIQHSRYELLPKMHEYKSIKQATVHADPSITFQYLFHKET